MNKNIKINEKICKIEEVKENDFILSFNIEKKEHEYRKVEKTHDIVVKHENQIRITFNNGDGYTTSKWHPSLVIDENNNVRYIRADEIKIGNKTLNEKKEICEVVNIDNNPCVNELYSDLTVNLTSNYCCSTNGKDFYVIHNTRKGAIAVYMEPWHIDINDFIDLKKNSGEERRRAHDLFPALWIPDLFMERVLKDAHWTLFDPHDVPELHEVYGKEFEKLYEECELNETLRKETIKAKDLWKKILTSYFESGSPFLNFKDSANRKNPNDHKGIIHSSNLCTEIFQNTSPNKYKIRIENEDGSINLYEEQEIVKLDNGIEKRANKVTAMDIINGKKIFIIEKEKEEGETAVCNLSSVNLSRINTKKDIERVVPIAIRMLDNVIDLNFYPLRKVKVTNLKTRAIGLGVMGEAQMLAEAQIHFGSKEHFEKIDTIMEAISYNAIKSSCNIAKEKGSYSQFKGSKWEKGIFPMDLANEKVNALTSRTLNYNWEELKQEVKENGMRNGYLMAIAPTSSISILVGTSQSTEPIYKRKWYEENLSGLIPCVAPNLSPNTWEYYVPAYDVEQKDIVKAASIRQKWIDQGQSTNIFIKLEKASAKYLHEIYILAWELGTKSTYYLRGQSAETKKVENSTDVVDRSAECVGCQ
jgi:ribonucleoside-diphosphate reductase alpha chain